MSDADLLERMPTIVHFDLPADDPGRARQFYGDLFGWKFMETGFPDFSLVETRALDGSPGVGGGLGKRGVPEQRIMNYIGVASIDEYVERVISLGGTVTFKKTAVPGFGYLANCMDTEGNAFGLWQEDPAAR